MGDAALVASRLEYAGSRPVAVVVTTSSDAGLAPGTRFWILGNDLPVNERGFGWLGATTGRRNTVTPPQRRPAAPGRLGRASAERRAEALRLVAEGVSWAHAAAAVGVAKSTCGDWVRQTRRAA